MRRGGTERTRAGPLARGARPFITPPHAKSPFSRILDDSSAHHRCRNAGLGPRGPRLREEQGGAAWPRAVAHDRDRSEQLSVARGARHGVLRAVAPSQPEQRRDHHRLVCQPEGAGRASQAHRHNPRPGSSRRRAASLRIAPGQPERRVGRSAGFGRDGPEARGHHPDAGPRPSPHRRSGLRPPAMDSRFNAAEADARWQARWAEQNSFAADSASGKPKTYVLEMFPYPSGRIHMGHVRNYTMGDVIARYRRMQGHEVLHPMGWDAFGMPAENAAMERKVHPGEWTWHNIEVMRGQLKQLGFALDWSREFATCDPAYYGQEQALFLDLFDAGLVYRKESEVNWDPVDLTVLANEQVIDGCGWRSGAPVERRKLNQWFLKITDFADDLLEGLQTLDAWPDKVRLMQENWIGKSRGLQFGFRLAEPVSDVDS